MHARDEPLRKSLESVLSVAFDRGYSLTALCGSLSHVHMIDQDLDFPVAVLASVDDASIDRARYVESCRQAVLNELNQLPSSRETTTGLMLNPLFKPSKGQLHTRNFCQKRLS